MGLLVEVLNIYQSINQVFVNTAKVATLPEQDKFTPDLDKDCCYTEKNIESVHADVEQTTFVSPPIETTNQEIEVQSYSKQIKKHFGLFETEDLHEEGTTTTQPNDINELFHLEDHCYSLGPSKDSLTSDNKDIVEPCQKPWTIVSVGKLPLVECVDDQIEVNVESTKQVYMFQ